MFLGRVEGMVWATVKDERLAGHRLFLMQPLDEDQQPVGSVVVAVDTVGSREGDLVYWVSSTEASYVSEGPGIPTEISIVGIVDRVDLTPPDELP